MAKDYYQILGVPRNTAQEQIKKSYRKLAMQYHPDRNPGKEKWANEKFKEINEAFGVLGDPQKRRQYDQFGTVGNIGDIFGSPFTRTTFEDLMQDFGGSGLGFDFLDNVFGDALKGRGFSFRTFSMKVFLKRARFENYLPCFCWITFCFVCKSSGPEHLPRQLSGCLARRTRLRI